MMSPTYLFSCLQLHPDVNIGVLPPPHLCLILVTCKLFSTPLCKSIHLNYYKSWLECRVLTLDILHLRKATKTT